jgi:hypothetical protein
MPAACWCRNCGQLGPERREARDKLADAIIDGRTARALTRLSPLAPHELPVPAQQRFWRHDQAASALLRQDSRQRGKQRAIGEAQRGTPLLPSEHDELMSQDEQLDIFGELAAAAADQQPQHSREGEIGEGKEHAPMLPSPTTNRSKNVASRQRPSCEAKCDLVLARTRGTLEPAQPPAWRTQPAF